jgi:hypothetical protein
MHQGHRSHQTNELIVQAGEALTKIPKFFSRRRGLESSSKQYRMSHVDFSFSFSFTSTLAIETAIWKEGAHARYYVLQAK